MRLFTSDKSLGLIEARVMREIGRRTRVVGNFPNGNSAVVLVAARLRHIAGTKSGARVYLDTEHFREYAPAALAAAPA